MSRDHLRLRTEQYGTSANLNARLAIHQRFSINAYGWYRWVFDRILTAHPGNILEIGCGPGTLWESNAERVPEQWRVVLSDFSLGMAREARLRPASSPGSRFVVCDAEALAFPTKTFDCVIANHMLYHVRDRAAALREIARVLQNDGCLVAATNGADHLREIDLLARRHGFHLDVLANGHFTLENGAAQLRRVFADVACELYDDRLEITESESLIQYVLSAAAGGSVETLEREVQNELAAKGCFRVRKSAGVFIARRPHSALG